MATPLIDDSDRGGVWTSAILHLQLTVCRLMFASLLSPTFPQLEEKSGVDLIKEIVEQSRPPLVVRLAECCSGSSA